MEEIKVVGLIGPIKILNTFEGGKKTRMDFCFDDDFNDEILEGLTGQTAYAINVEGKVIAGHYLHDVNRILGIKPKYFSEPITIEEAEKCEGEYYRYITENLCNTVIVTDPFNFEYYHLLPDFFEGYFNSIGMIIK